MSWWARSLVNSLRGDDDDEEEEAEETKKTQSSNEKSHIESPKAREEGHVEGGEEEEEGRTPTRGVKEDLSELTETLTRRFWGVASFLAPPPPPPPPPGPDAGDLTVPGQSDEAASAESPRIAGIRSDFAEIGGQFRSGISSVLSHTKAVSEISKIASSLMPFGSDEGEVEGVGIDAIGVNEEVLAFARNIAMHPETWLDFPLPHGEEDSDDFEMSGAQLEHALAVERLAPEFAALRTELCPSQMGEGCFWKIYFVLLHSRLNRHDAELLSTPEIVEARSMLLQDLHSWTKQGPEKLEREASYGKEDVTAGPVEENVVRPSSALNVTVPPTTLSHREPVSDSTRDIETENHPVQTIATNFMEDVETEKHPVQTIATNFMEDVETEKHPVQTIATNFVEDVETEKHPVQTIASGSVEDVETEKHPVQTAEVNIVNKSVIEEEPANQGKGKDEEDGDEWLEDDTGEASGARGGAISLGQEEDVSFSDLEEADDDE